MNMFLEVTTYLVIILGFITVMITFLNREMFVYMSKDNYIRSKHKDIKVKAKIVITGLNEDEANRIGWIIERGGYESIYDVVDEYEVVAEK